MPHLSPRSLALSLLCTIAPTLAVLELPTAAPATAATTVDDGLGESMQGLVGGLKALSKSLADPALNQASLASLAEMQKHTLAAKEFAPSNLAEIEEKDQGAHKLAYRADLTRLLRELCEMEIEVCEGKNEEALARVRGALIPLRNASHEKYQAK